MHAVPDVGRQALIELAQPGHVLLEFFMHGKQQIRPLLRLDKPVVLQGTLEADIAGQINAQYSRKNRKKLGRQELRAADRFQKAHMFRLEYHFPLSVSRLPLAILAISRSPALTVMPPIEPRKNGGYGRRRGALNQRDENYKPLSVAKEAG
jgi:hypothetical protein